MFQASIKVILVYFQMRSAEEYLPFVFVKHQKLITTTYLHYIDYKIRTGSNVPLARIVDAVRQSYNNLEPHQQQVCPYL